MLDYHIHPDYSIDAEPYSMEDYCIRAVELGLEEICFTPHFEFDPARAHIDWFVRQKGKIAGIGGNWLEEYFQEGYRLRQVYRDQGLVIRLGLEIGFDWGLEEAISRVTQAYPFDFILGSIHCIDHVAISSAAESAAYLPQTNLKAVAEKYYRVLLEGVKSGLFDVTAHLDIYRRYGQRYFGDAVNDVYRMWAEPIFSEMSRRGVGLEINTSSIKQKQKEFYPPEDVVRLARKQGVKIFTTGSDAHRLSELGQGLASAETIIAGVGCRPARYAGRQLVKESVSS